MLLLLQMLLLAQMPLLAQMLLLALALNHEPASAFTSFASAPARELDRPSQTLARPDRDRPKKTVVKKLGEAERPLRSR